MSIKAMVSSATASWLTPGVLQHPDPAGDGGGSVDRVVADAAARDDLQCRLRWSSISAVTGSLADDRTVDAVEQGQRVVGVPRRPTQGGR